jgi:hypothetical protein
MPHKNGKNQSDKHGALASLKSELALPRIARSARIAQLNLDARRISERPSTSMPGTVDKIISPQIPGESQTAQISVNEPTRSGQDLLIENTLTDENGDEVRLKKGAHVDITVTDETKPAKRNV